MCETVSQLVDNLEPLIKKCIDRDRAAQARLYTLFSVKMLAVCIWYARNKEEAEEILHDGFLKVFTYLHTYSGQGSFEGWMRKIMVNAALSTYRNKSSLMFRIVELTDEHYNTYETPDFIFNHDEKKLLELIQQLPPSYRLVFSLYVFEGLKHKEISKLLNISEGTSKSNLADARKMLKVFLMKISLIKSV